MRNTADLQGTTPLAEEQKSNDKNVTRNRETHEHAKTGQDVIRRQSRRVLCHQNGPSDKNLATNSFAARDRYPMKIFVPEAESRIDISSSKSKPTLTESTR
ncbi:hypothetical protein MMC28_008481, partial [Mycoblastus sanguinarius]|nr:hypothetical protein [Mycoblastus sanguinarius]